MSATLTGPMRIQRKRTRGWRMPEGAVYVGRLANGLGGWGNPYVVSEQARAMSQTGNHSKANALFNALLRKYADDAFIWTEAGKALERAGMQLQARTCFARAAGLLGQTADGWETSEPNAEDPA